MKQLLAFLIAAAICIVGFGYGALYLGPQSLRSFFTFRGSNEWQQSEIQEGDVSTSVPASPFADVLQPEETRTSKDDQIGLSAESTPEAMSTIDSHFQATTMLGIVVPKMRARIRAEVIERIVELNVQPGDSVKSGQIVGRLDSRPLALQIERQQSRQAALAARVNESKTLVALAEDRADRTALLIQTGAATDAERTQTKLELAAAQFRLKALEHDYQEAVAEAKRMEYLLKDYDLVSPLDGIVTNVVNQRGELVDQAEVILRVSSDDKLLRVHLPPSLVGNLSKMSFEYFDDHWRAISVFMMSPDQNPDGTHNLLLKVPADHELATGRVIQVRAQSEKAE